MAAVCCLRCRSPPDEGLDYDEIEGMIDIATKEADEAGIHGAAATPWLLRRMVEISEGKTLAANTALLANNGKTAAQIAVALAEMSKKPALGF